MITHLDRLIKSKQHTLHRRLLGEFYFYVNFWCGPSIVLSMECCCCCELVHRAWNSQHMCVPLNSLLTIIGSFSFFPSLRNSHVACFTTKDKIHTFGEGGGGGVGGLAIKENKEQKMKSSLTVWGGP